MSQRRWLAAGGLLLAACVTYGQEVERVQKSLIGLPGLTLRRCMPVPTATHTDGDTELVSYRWAYQADADDEVRRDPFEVGPPNEVRRRREERDFLMGREIPRGQPFCELTFELRDQKIAAVRSRGRDASGLNADARCLMEARPCLPEPPAR